MTNNMNWDICMTDYPRLAGETSDDKRIMRAVNDCAGGVLFFPKGIYEIAGMLTVDNACSFLLKSFRKNSIILIC